MTNFVRPSPRSPDTPSTIACSVPLRDAVAFDSVLLKIMAERDEDGEVILGCSRCGQHLELYDVVLLEQDILPQCRYGNTAEEFFAHLRMHGCVKKRNPRRNL